MAHKKNRAALPDANAVGGGFQRDAGRYHNSQNSPVKQRILQRPRAQVDLLLECPSRLSRKELAFVRDMQVNLRLYPDATDRQKSWLDAIYQRVWCQV
jgi:hypothetical protein